MSTKFTMTRLANARAVRLRVYAGGHQVHVDLEPFDLEELVRDALKHARDLGLVDPVAANAPKKRKRKTKTLTDIGGNDWES